MSTPPRPGLLDVFVNSGLRDAQWPNVTCALLPPAVFETAVIEWNDGEGGTHAEVKLIGRLWDLVHQKAADGYYTPGHTVRIPILQNYSPCNSCSEAYGQFYSSVQHRYNIRVHLQIAFTALYYINRPSFLPSGRSDECSGGQTTAHTENVRGLRMLRQIGVDVRPFREGDWTALVSAVHWDILRVRREEDFSLQADFQRVLAE